MYLKNHITCIQLPNVMQQSNGCCRLVIIKSQELAGGVRPQPEQVRILVALLCSLTPLGKV